MVLSQAVPGECPRIVDSTFSFPGSSAEPVLSCGGVRLRALFAFFPFSLLLPFPPRAPLGPKPKGTDPEGSGRISDPKMHLGAGRCRVSAGRAKHVQSPISLFEIKLCLWFRQPDP